MSDRALTGMLRSLLEDLGIQPSGTGSEDLGILELEVKRLRAEDAAARANLGAVGVTESGPIDQLVCTLAGLYLEIRAAQTASEERMRAVVLAGIEEYARYPEGAPLGGHGTVACDIATRAAKQLAGGVGLSEEERNHLLSVRTLLKERSAVHSDLWGAEIATLDRLLRGAP